ncbi:MAG: hypothetical protein ABI333_02885 [bacterium]
MVTMLPAQLEAVLPEGITEANLSGIAHISGRAPGDGYGETYLVLVGEVLHIYYRTSLFSDFEELGLEEEGVPSIDTSGNHTVLRLPVPDAETTVRLSSLDLKAVRKVLLAAAGASEEETGAGVMDPLQPTASPEPAPGFLGLPALPSGAAFALLKSSWERFVAAALARSRDLETLDDRVTALAEAAQVYEELLDAPTRAFKLLKIAYSLEPGHEGVAARLERTAGKTGRRAEYLALVAESARSHPDETNWGDLERQYRRRVEQLQVGQDDEELLTLLTSLGEIYVHHLANADAAIEAYTLASRLEPDNFQHLEMLARLYDLAAEPPKDAASVHRRLLAASPYRFDSYHSLYRQYFVDRQYDQAWCLATALCFLGKATDEETALYEQYRQKGFARARQRMSHDLWQQVICSSPEQRLLGALFGVLAPVVARTRARPYKDWRIRRKDRRDIATDQLLFSKVFNYCVQVLNLQEVPELFLRQEMRGGIQLAFAEERGQLIPFCVVGADLLQGRSEKELAYVIAHELSFLRPEHSILKSVQTVAELKMLLYSAMKVVNPAIPVPPELDHVVEVTVGQLVKRTHPAQLEQLSAVVKKLAQISGVTDLEGWLRTADYSANHAGYLLCNDLEVAAALIAREPVPVGGVSAKQKVRELVLYAISEPYFEARRQLGLTIGE